MSSELIKISIIILVAVVLITMLRNLLPEYSFLLTATVIAIVLLLILDKLFTAINSLSDLFEQSGNVYTYFVTALKALGISYITVFSADICRDYGLSALAQTAEIAGKTAIFMLSIPLVEAVLKSAIDFVGS